MVEALTSMYPVYPYAYNPYPKMLYRGTESRVVENAAEKARAEDEGFVVRASAPAEPVEDAPDAVVDVLTLPAKRGPGRPRKDILS